MTPEQRIIAHLEAELARERAEKAALLEMVHALTVKRGRSAGAERQARYRETKKAASVTSDVTVTRNSDASLAPPPPLHGSPLPPAPSIPSPLSSPLPLVPAASQSETPEQPALIAVPATPKAVGRSTALGEFIDWAKAETRKQLPPDAPDNCRMERHQASRLGEAVKHHGLEALKAGFRLFMGWQVAQERAYPLGLFAAKWEDWVGQAKVAGPTAREDERARVARESREAYLAEQRAKKAAGGAV